MKTILAILIILAVVSCQNQNSNFRRFDGFEIGTDFRTSPAAKAFRNDMNNEFNLPDYKLSDEIGSVSNLNITTNDSGKIIQVDFKSNVQTNVSEIEKAMKGLTLVKIPEQTKNASFDIKGYQSADEEFVVTELLLKDQTLKNGQARRQYSYMNKEAIAANRKVMESMILKNPQYLKQRDMDQKPVQQ